MKNARRLVATLTLPVLLLPGAVFAVRNAPGFRLRMDGYVGPRPEGRREMADLLLRAGKKDVPFQVTAATVLSGEMLPTTVFARVRPYRPNFILRGNENLLRQVENAGPGERLRIVGLWRSGARDLLVSSIETPPPDHQPTQP
jgi:hypothetical protein